VVENQCLSSTKPVAVNTRLPLQEMHLPKIAGFYKPNKFLSTDSELTLQV